MIQFKMEGWKELAKGLEDLGDDKEVRKVMRDALKKRALPMAAMAQSLAPKHEGTLARSIGVSTQLKRSQRRGRVRTGINEVEVFVGSSDPKAHLVEFGTGPRYHKSGKYVGQVAPQPFMRPAWEATKDSILHGFAKDLWAGIERAAKRIARRQARLLRGR